MSKYFKLIIFSFSLFIVISCTKEPEGESSDIKQISENINEMGNLVTENIPEIPEDIKNRSEQYQNARSAGFAGWAPDGSGIFITTRFSETTQLHFVSQAGGYRKQLTYFDEPISGVAIRPSSEKPGLLFLKDIGGNEMYQIYYMDLSSGKYDLLTDPETRNGGFKWSDDANKFAYQSNKRNGKDFDIYVVNMNDPKNHKMIYEGTGYWGALDWSPDGKKLLISNYVSINESTIYIFYPATGEKKPLQISDDKIAMGDAVWSKDGNGIYFSSDKNSEFKKLHYMDIESGVISLLSEDIDWDVEGITQSKDGKWLAFFTNENGRAVTYLLDLKSKKRQKLDNVSNGLVTGAGFSPDNKSIALSLSTSKTAGDVFVMDVRSQNLKRWTFSEIGGLNTDDFIEPELISYPTFDKSNDVLREIPAYYYKPEGDGPFPVIIYFHGGPESQFRPGFTSTFQYWIKEQGIAVIAPNIRGSSGYGKSFLLLDNGKLRENSVKDGGALLDWIATRPELDQSKVAVFGGSYGGYMVLAMMTNYNDRIAAGIDIVGISNFVTFLKNTKDYRRDLRRVEYGDERDPEMMEFLNKISPTTNADKISKPLLIIQGANDPRVPLSEAEQMKDVIKKNGGQVWYLMAKDEGHGFAKKSNRDFSRNAVVLFWQEMLLK